MNIDQKRTILIVNCTVDRANFLKKIIAMKPGFRVLSSVYDGIEGLKAARELKPDILFSCISLPSKSGLELTRIFKHEFPKSGVVIGTITANTKLAAYEAGADYYFQYPAKIDEIHHALDVTLARMRRPVRQRYPAQTPKTEEVPSPVRTEQKPIRPPLSNSYPAAPKNVEEANQGLNNVPATGEQSIGWKQIIIALLMLMAFLNFIAVVRLDTFDGIMGLISIGGAFLLLAYLSQGNRIGSTKFGCAAIGLTLYGVWLILTGAYKGLLALVG